MNFIECWSFHTFFCTVSIMQEKLWHLVRREFWWKTSEIFVCRVGIEVADPSADNDCLSLARILRSCPSWSRGYTSYPFPSYSFQAPPTLQNIPPYSSWGSSIAPQIPAQKRQLSFQAGAQFGVFVIRGIWRSGRTPRGGLGLGTV